jgi:RimJ/RimL family protein N-acetyltransferase
MSYLTFETERLYLRPTTIEDAAFIFELLNSPKWIKFIGDREIRSVEDAKSYILNKMTPQLEKLGYSNYTLILKDKKIKIGTCGLYDREDMDGIDIGFAMLPKFEGKGFGFEAANELKKAANSEFGITELFGITTKDNVSSQKLLIKLGLKLKGTVNLPDDEEELLLFVLKM